MGELDITKTGGLNYRETQKLNDEQQFGVTDPPENALTRLQRASAAIPYTPAVQNLGYEDLPEGYGESKYDRRMPMWALDDLEDWRGKQQSGVVQIANGIGKGAALAGTTFLDGTVGLIYGLASIPTNGVSGIWDNAFSNAMQDINKEMEKILPNYRTAEERDRKWYQNLGTANFWGDSFLKNMGFTVGAFYSGGAWNGAFKALGILKRGITAQAVGSFLSAFNEGRIEANNGQREFLELENLKINDAYNKRRDEILNSNLSDEDKTTLLQQTADETKLMYDEAKERAHVMGLTTLIGNTALLTFGNLIQFGKLYSRGFDTAKDLAGKTVRKNGLNNLELAAQQEASGVTREATEQGVRYGVNEITKGQAVARGLLNPLTEGHEEMAQKVIQTWAGNRVSSDDPDTYYKALIDPEHRDEMLKTNSALSKAIVDTWGNIDNWEEFAIGALTGALGMPTFGKVNNSSAETYLGKGKTIGLSGGIAGAIRSATERNKQASEAAEVMNKYMEKLAEKQNYFVQSSSYTDAMDGYAAENNRFEWNNYKDNDDFAAIEAFSRTGHLDDLRDMVNQDFENISDEELQNIALNISSDIKLNPDGTVATTDDDGKVITGAWRNADGTLKSSTEKGRAKMREDLAKKRDSILKGINEYEKSVTRVRGIANGSLDESQIQELAWLHWKGQRFKERYQSIKSDNDNFLQAFESGIEETFSRINRAQEIREELQRKEGESISEWNSRLRGKDKRGRALKTELNRLSKEAFGAIDPSDEEQSVILKQLSAIREFFRYVKKFDDPEKLGAVLNAGKDILDALQNDALISIIARSASNLDNDTFNKGLEDLQDIAKIGAAAKTFQDRYQEFIDNPLSQQQNRDKLDEEAQQKQDLVSDLQSSEKIKDMSIQELRQQAAQGNVNLEELSKDTDMPEVAQKAQEALDIDKKIAELESIIEANPDLDEQVKNDASTLLRNAGNLVEVSAEELEDFGRLAYQDTHILDMEDMPDVSIEEQDNIANQRKDKAVEAIINASEESRERAKEMQDKPSNLEQSVEEAQNSQAEETGHDGTTTTPSTQEQKETQRIKEQQNISVQQYVEKLMSSHPVLSTFPDDLKTSIANELSALFSWIKKHNSTPIKELLNDIIKPKSAAYEKLSRVIGEDLDLVLTHFYNASKTTPEQQSQSEEKEPTTLTTNTDVNTLTNPKDGAKEATNRDTQEKADLPKFPNGKIRYWRRNTPTHIIDKNTGLPVRWEPTSQRDKEVVSYHEEHGTFDRLDRGEVQEGDEVVYIIDSSLNERAGEVVILIAKKRTVGDSIVHDIIGDVSSKNSENLKQYEGLAKFIERVEKEYEEFTKSGKTGIFESKETNHVAKLMSGYILYTDNTDTNRKTLNTIFKDKKFHLGVATTDGSLSASVRIKPDGSSLDRVSDLESLIIQPISPNIKKGQPFLLVETGNRKKRGYVTVPISMPKISSEHSDKGLYQAIQNVVERIVESKKKNITGLKDRLLQFVNIPNIYFAFDDQGNLTKVTRYVNDTQKVHYDILPNSTTAEIVQTIMKDFEGLSYRVDRALFDSTYNGQSYNSMVGELAETNLPEDFTHTVGNWFVTNILDGNGKEIKAQAPKSTGNTTAQQKITNNIQKEIQQGKNTSTSQSANNTTQQELEAMSQDEYAEWLKQNGLPSGTNKGELYDMMTARKKYRGNRFLKRVSDYASVSDKLRNLADNILNKVAQDLLVNKLDGIESSTKGAGWNHFIINDDTLHSSETPKGYITLTQDAVLNLTPDTIINFLKAVQESGFNGQVKYPAVASRMFLAFDNFVIHGRTQEDVNKVMKIAEDFFKEKIEALQTGLDRNGTSHSDVLANDVAKSLENKTNQQAQQQARQTASPNTTQTLLDRDVDEITEGLNEIMGQVASQDLNKQAKDRKLFSKFSMNKMWNAMSNEEKEALLNIDDIKLGSIISFLGAFVFDKTSNQFKKAALKGKSLLEYLQSQSSKKDTTIRKFRVADKVRETANTKRELRVIARSLPQLSQKEVIRLHKGLIKINNSKSPAYAWGQFKNGIITLSDTAARGTLYHESFHFVFNSLLTDDEIIKIYDAAKEIYGDKSYLALEEDLAEDFRRYMQFQEELEIAKESGNIQEWNRIKSEIKSLLNKLNGKTHILNNLFSDIYNRKYAERVVNNRNAAQVATEREMQSIKEKAIANGTFMQTPNGKLTNLNERQWLQVRTKAFLNWFGDWIDDYENASKVVDENGEPLVVIHSNGGLSDVASTLQNQPYRVVKTFDLDSRPDRYQRGAKYEDLNKLPSKVLSVLFSNAYLSFTKDYVIITQSNNRLEEDRRFNLEHNIKELQKAIKLGRNIHIDAENINIYNPKNFVRNIAEVSDFGIATTFFTKKTEEGIKYSSLYGPVTGEFFLNIKNVKYYNKKEKDTKHFARGEWGTGNIFLDSLVEDGFDGAAAFANTSRSEYVVSSPNQIKSAIDNIGTFNEDDNIRYRRFETTQEYDNEIQKLNKELDEKSKTFNNWVNQIKQKYTTALSKINRKNVLVWLGQRYYYIDTGRVTDEGTKNSYLGDRGLEDFGQVVSHKNHWTILIPTTIQRAIENALEKSSVYSNMEQTINALDDEITRLEVEKSEGISGLDDFNSRKIKDYQEKRLMFDNLTEDEKQTVLDAGFSQETWDNSVTFNEKDDFRVCRM